MDGHDSAFVDDHLCLDGHDSAFVDDHICQDGHDSAFDVVHLCLDRHDSSFVNDHLCLDRHDSAFVDDHVCLDGHDSAFDGHDDRVVTLSCFIRHLSWPNAEPVPGISFSFLIPCILISVLASPTKRSKGEESNIIQPMVII